MLYVYVIFLFIAIIIVCIFAIFAFKVHITSKIIAVRNDLFYISQNCQMALKKNKLEYNEYVIDENELQKIAIELINKNYNGEVSLNYVDYNSMQNVITIKVNLKIKPIIKIGSIAEVNLPVEGTYKLKLMEAYNE